MNFSRKYSNVLHALVKADLAMTEAGTRATAKQSNDLNTMKSGGGDIVGDGFGDLISNSPRRWVVVNQTTRMCTCQTVAAVGYCDEWRQHGDSETLPSHPSTTSSRFNEERKRERERKRWWRRFTSITRRFASLNIHGCIYNIVRTWHRANGRPPYERADKIIICFPFSSFRWLFIFFSLSSLCFFFLLKIRLFFSLSRIFTFPARMTRNELLAPSDGLSYQLENNKNLVVDEMCSKLIMLIRWAERQQKLDGWM